MMENYLHIVYALARPDMLRHVVDAHIGLKTGTHEFAKLTSGKIDPRRIIRKSDGLEYAGHISYYKMSESSPHAGDQKLFDHVYSALSEYTHPSFVGITLVLKEDGTLDPLSNELQAEGLIYSICFAAMILAELGKLSRFSEAAKIDISTVVRRVTAAAVDLLKAMSEDGKIADSLEALRRRLVGVDGESSTGTA